MLGLFAQLPDAPQGWDSLSAEGALTFVAITGFGTIVGIAWFFVREHIKMGSLIRDIHETQSKENRLWRAHNRKQVEKLITAITTKIDERHVDLVKAISNAIIGHSDGK